MSRITVWALGLGLLVGACGGAAGSGGASPAPPPSASPTSSSGPVAPDFTLALGEGGTFTLSEGTKPVYMVFWAEW